MSTQTTTRKRLRITNIVTVVLAILAAAIVFAPQASAGTAPKFVKSWGGVAFPSDSAMDSQGNIYLFNAPDDRIQKYTKDGAFIKEWGSTGSAPGQFDNAQGLGIDSQDHLYVADTLNDRIQKFSTEGDLLDVIGGTGSGNGQLDFPTDVAAGVDDVIYVTDSGNDRVQRFNSAGNYMSKWGTTGSGSGQFDNGIFGIATDETGNVYVSEASHDRIQKFAHNGTYLTKWGNKGDENGEFDNPMGMTFDEDGNLLVTDSNNDRVQAFSTTGQFEYKFGQSGNGAADLAHPTGVSVHAGRIYVSDEFHARVKIFEHELGLAIPPKGDDPIGPGEGEGEQPQGGGQGDPVPAPGEAEFDGKNLHIRLKCPLRFNPSCLTSAMPMTKERGGKKMAVKPAKRKLAPGKWTVVSFVIKPQYRAKVQKMTDRDRKLLHVTQTIKSVSYTHLTLPTNREV